MAKATVCILTAGKGTRMGSYYKHVNKALLPINKKAIISHIIELFPSETEFVVAVGYLADQVKDYLMLAHPQTAIYFVEVENYDGPGSGPGHSLLCCESYLRKPFYFVSCDTLWSNLLDFDLDRNWLGVAKVPAEITQTYCNFEINNGFVVGVKDKVHAPWPPYKAFVGLCFFKDYAIFWDGLKSKTLIAGEHQISNGIHAIIQKGAPLAIDIEWNDVGNLEQYKRAVGQYEDFDFGKSEEFLYILNGKVIKFFTNSTITEKRVQKSKLNPFVFPQIKDVRRGFYTYDFMYGKTLYQRNSPYLFQKFLQWLKERLWSEVSIDRFKMRDICKKFYYDKTMERLKLYHEKYPTQGGPAVINELEVPSTAELMSLLPWEDFYSGIPTFFHGDLQFDNILYNEKEDRFILIDWRQDFGGRIDMGDLYYDLAKLYGGIILNYDLIKLNLLSYFQKDGEITIDFAQRFLSQTYLDILSDFVKSHGWSLSKVRLLVCLIYLNMAPLHHYPFDQMLYSLGRYILTKELQIHAK